MSKIIIANWKMNPQTLTEAQELFKFTIEQASRLGEENLNIIICPPFVFIEELAKMLAPETGNVTLGAQDIFWEIRGAYTGEISPEMLKNFRVRQVLIGHSDRRYVLGESDEIINKKIKAALEADIRPVLLVGEKEAGDIREDVLIDQISRDLEGLTANEISKILFAYEPVWAISTSSGAKADTPENAIEAIGFIRQVITRNWKPRREVGAPTSNISVGASGLSAISFLYGGSVNEKNIADFLRRPEINGAVVGGASLRKEEFGRMLELASAIK